MTTNTPHTHRIRNTMLALFLTLSVGATLHAAVDATSGGGHEDAAAICRTRTWLC